MHLSSSSEGVKTCDLLLSVTKVNFYMLTKSLSTILSQNVMGLNTKMPTRKDFLKNMTTQDNKEETKLNKENKETKEAKKEMKEIIKGNKEVLENIIEDNKISAERMEAQIDSIGDKISTSVGAKIANLARIMTQFMRQDKAGEEPIARQKPALLPPEQMKKDGNSQDLFEEDEEEQASLPCGQGTYRKDSQSQQNDCR